MQSSLALLHKYQQTTEFSTDDLYNHRSKDENYINDTCEHHTQSKGIAIGVPLRMTALAALSSFTEWTNAVRVS